MTQHTEFHLLTQNQSLKTNQMTVLAKWLGAYYSNVANTRKIKTTFRVIPLLKYKLLVITLAIFMQSCNKQVVSSKEIYNKEFKWKIVIPESFENVSVQEWAKIQNKGANAIEKTYDTEVTNQAKTIFVFKSDQMNYFESNYQPFDTAVDGSYSEYCLEITNMLYETFKTQMPNMKIDTVRTTEKIDGLAFKKFEVKLEFPDKKELHALMFSRLFGKRELSVNIMYVDKEKGKKMLESWTQSKFNK
jgi:hypothetical protein